MKNNKQKLQMKMKPNHIIISGGGTGGHVFPAIAIADALMKKRNDLNILFVGAKGRMEMDKVPAEGYRIVGLPIRGIQRKISFQNILFVFSLIRSLWRSRKIIKTFRPSVIVGVGGYASYPIIRSGRNKGIPALIQEQNSFPGLTNRLLGKHVQRICVAYEDTKAYFPEKKVINTGNPVREDLRDVVAKREKGQEFFQLDPHKKTLVVLGGSLGAKSLNESMQESLEELIQQDIQVIWQAGKFYYEEIQKQIENMNARNIQVYKFIKEMDLVYAVADVIISRAGALAVSEISFAGIPAIFVPSPNVVADHQTRNVSSLVKNEAAKLVPDDQARFTLVRAALDLIHNEDECHKLAENIRKMAVKDSADVIADEVLELMNG